MLASVPSKYFMLEGDFGVIDLVCGLMSDGISGLPNAKVILV